MNTKVWMNSESLTPAGSENFLSWNLAPKKLAQGGAGRALTAYMSACVCCCVHWLDCMAPYGYIFYDSSIQLTQLSTSSRATRGTQYGHQ